MLRARDEPVPRRARKMTSFRQAPLHAGQPASQTANTRFYRVGCVLVRARDPLAAGAREGIPWVLAVVATGLVGRVRWGAWLPGLWSRLRGEPQPRRGLQSFYPNGELSRDGGRRRAGIEGLATDGAAGAPGDVVAAG